MPLTLHQLLLSAGATALVYVFWKVAQFVLHPYFSPLRYIPGPKSTSWFYGSLKETWAIHDLHFAEKCADQYGPVYKSKGMLNTDQLTVTDTKALHHILNHAAIYEKPDLARKNFHRMMGPGLLVVEGDEHKTQRRVMNPAFAPTYIREMTDIFVEKTVQLRDMWMSKMPASGEPLELCALTWLSRLTLDIIGLAGFNYEFDALNADTKVNELSEAFTTLFHAGSTFDAVYLLQMWSPIFKIFPAARATRVDRARSVMSRIGNHLLAEKKAAVLQSNGEKGGAVDRKAVQGRDLLSLLVRANMAADLPENQRLSDEEVLAQVPTFLIAGHETTSTAVTWVLYSLCLRPDVQSKLRDELFTLDTDSPTMDELNALPYLEVVVRESMRVHTPVVATSRVAMKDDVIPLNKPFMDLNGNLQDHIRISKGERIEIPVVAVQRSKEIWGDDAREFKPERWETDQKAASSIPGVWSQSFSFIGGQHACIGYRFSLVEMKAMLFVLVRAFEYELAVDPKDIRKKAMAVQRPTVVGHGNKNEMPLRVRPFRRQE